MRYRPPDLTGPGFDEWSQPLDGGGRGTGAVSRPGAGLLDARAERVLQRYEQLCADGDYPFQLPLEGMAGPRISIAGRPLLLLSSYDYLGLIHHPAVNAAALAAVRQYGTGTGGVRLLTGTTQLHHHLEREIAAFKGCSAAISFSSGYAANMAAIPALLTPHDRVILDSLAHRSLVDSCRLAGVSIRRFRHDDPTALRTELARGGSVRGRTMIVAEGVYSMDGDLCPLPEIVRLKEEFGAFLMIDESHSLGVLGATGRGVDEHFGMAADRVDLWSASLGKAIPSSGGVLMGSRELVVYLQHAAAPFVFSAAACPAAVGAARAAVSVLLAEPERVARVHRLAERLRVGLRDLDYDTGASASPIVPVILNDETRAIHCARRLRSLGVVVTPIIHPAVPQGAARLRLCATAAHSESDIDEALQAFRLVRRD